jgi:hypothetical protein
MTENQGNNNSNQTSTSDKVLNNLVNNNPTSDEEILKLAHQQKADHEQERKKWEEQKTKKTKEQLLLIGENNVLRKELSGIKSQLSALQFKGALEEQSASSQTGENVKLPPEMEVKRILAEVISERKQRAVEKRQRKNDNVFFM